MPIWTFSWHGGGAGYGKGTSLCHEVSGFGYGRCGAYYRGLQGTSAGLTKSSDYPLPVEGT